MRKYSEAVLKRQVQMAALSYRKQVIVSCQFAGLKKEKPLLQTAFPNESSDYKVEGNSNRSSQ